MAYVDVGGVRTWYEVLGEGEPLVLLHPGGFDSRAMAEPAAALAESYTVYLPDRRADGSTFLSHGGSRQGALCALVP